MTQKVERILVPVDFSTGSRSALEYAVFLARQLDATLEVLHVVRPLPTYVIGSELMLEMPDGRHPLATVMRSSAQREMEELLASS